MPATTKPKSLIAKLAEITGKLAHVEKKGYNKAQSYAFARESDIAAEASKLFAEYNIFLAQTVVGDAPWSPLYKTRSGQDMYLTEVMMEFTFYDGDSPDQTLGPLRFPGHGADTGDKGIYKALTGAEKYFLMKTFLIATGDDPEGDEKVDKEAAGAAAGAGSRIKGGKAQTGTEKGGKTKAPSAAQKAEVKRLIKDKGMTPPTLLIAVSESTGKEVAPDADPKEVLADLSGEEIGKLITYVSEMVEIAAVEEPESENGEQESLAIV